MLDYRAKCLKEIYWDDQTYRPGDSIAVKRVDMDILRDAGVIGDIRKIEIETATIRAPEKATKSYKKTTRKKRASR